MKKSTKFMAMALVSVVGMSTASTLVGCSGKENKDLKDPTILNICIPDLGYGVDWLKSAAQGFTAKTGTKVNVDDVPTESGFVAAMYAGTAPYDIYCLRANNYTLVTANQANVSGYDPVLMDYDEIYNSQVGNETKPDGTPLLLKEKMKDMYEVNNRIYKTPEDEEAGNFHYYTMQWGDPMYSLVINNDVWKDTWDIPVTTDELLDLADTIKGVKGYWPFIWSSQASYWWETVSLWVTQYQGLEDMFGEQGFWSGYAENGAKNSPRMWQRNGFLEALKVLDTIVKDENGYCHTLSTSVDFTTAQGYFCMPENKIAMMANGDWLYNEMKENYPDSDLKMISLPVISAIRNHPDCGGTIGSDEELAALIKAIDAGSTALTGAGYDVSQAAYNKVYEARNMYGCGPNIQSLMVTPAWSDSKEIVKEFMLYIASEEGQIKMAQGGAGFTLGLEMTEGVWDAVNANANDFVKSAQAEKATKQVVPWFVYKSRLFAVGGMPVNPMIELGYEKPELIFSLSGSGYMDAEQLFVTNYQNAVTKWATFMQTAGLQ